MNFKIDEVDITTNASTYIGTIPAGKRGVTLHIAGTPDSATITAAWAKKDGTVSPYSATEASITAAGQISAFSGEGMRIYVTTSGGGGSIDISVTAAYW